MEKNEKKITEEKIAVEAPKKIKYQCLHTTEERECTCLRSKGLVLMK